ncbi:MAG: haeIIIM [Chryseobacterium sp.]|jgi:DNA (cytosine-5)-methyltransferase 1|uniref:DNA cytosine methyltransferase n=1 Tax=Chryseobacterium sp. TaxID=1871047 RepID=UPI00260F0EE9|nr:DNA (cytosine-5-)-methyltransferase [Chryseobacterium sp.]MDF2552859.1 haeIIIM [Chryseobacterium sp.]
MKKYNFIDLFAGCGGLSEGFLQTNKFNALSHVEWELPMISTLRHRLVEKWKHSMNDSYKKVIHFDLQKTEELLNGNWSKESFDSYSSTNDVKLSFKGMDGIVGDEKVDLIIGGPPCQAYSIHGRATDKNSMDNDYRNYLFESFVKIVNHYKPKIFVFENVPGMLSAKPGGVKITERIYQAFRDIGYNILEPEKLSQAVFDTSNFKVPQNRKRVILVGLPSDSKIKLQEVYSKIRFKEDITNKLTVYDAIGDLPKLYPLEKPMKIDGKNFSHTYDNSVIPNHIPRFHNSRDIEIFREWVGNNMNNYSQHQKIEYYYQKTNKSTLYSKYKNLEWKKQSQTVVAHLEKDGLMFIHPDAEQARSITVREAARLMTFPDDFKFIGSTAKCYKMIGNAVPVNFAKIIATSISEILDEKS